MSREGRYRNRFSRLKVRPLASGRNEQLAQTGTPQPRGVELTTPDFNVTAHKRIHSRDVQLGHGWRANIQSTNLTTSMAPLGPLSATGGYMDFDTDNFIQIDGTDTFAQVPRGLGGLYIVTAELIFYSTAAPREYSASLYVGNAPIPANGQSTGFFEVGVGSNYRIESLQYGGAGQWNANATLTGVFYLAENWKVSAFAKVNVGGVDTPVLFAGTFTGAWLGVPADIRRSLVVS